MGRKKALGRGDGGRRGGLGRGRSSPLPPIDEEVFQDSVIGEDSDSILEEQGFVVSSPVVMLRRMEPGTPSENRGNIAASLNSGQESELEELGQKANGIESSGGSKTAPEEIPPQKWGERVEAEGSEELKTRPGIPSDSKQKPDPLGQKRTWANVVGNSDPLRGIQLDYVPPVDGMVEFTEEDMAAGMDAWSNAVVGQIIGGDPSMKEVIGFVHRAWSRIEIPRVHKLQAGVFLFNFKTEEAKSKVMGRDWNLNQEPWFISDWSPDYKPETKKPTRRKVWIRLPGLKLQFWTKQGIEKIASGIGIPLATDFLTASKDTLKFARVLVDIDMAKPRLPDIKCKLPNGGFYSQKIEYENLPEQPRWEIGEKVQGNGKGKETIDIVIPIVPGSLETQPSQVTPETETRNQKKKRKKKKKGSTPLIDNPGMVGQANKSIVKGSGTLFPMDSEEGAASGGENAEGMLLPKPPDPGGNKSSVPSSSK